MFAQDHDAGFFLGHAPGFAQSAQTAGSESEVSGKTFDRQATLTAAQSANAGNRFRSVTAIVQVVATMASGNSVGVSLNFQDSPNDSDWTDYGTAMADTTVISAAGGAVTAKAATIRHTVDLVSARRYVRVQVLPNFSATGTDTGLFAAVLVLGGPQELPTDVVSAREP